MDIEGAEHLIIHNSNPIIWPSISRVVIEYHVGLGTGFPSDSNPEILVNIFYKHGYTHVKLLFIPGQPLGFIIAERA